MLDALAVITRAISEHHTIRGHIKLAGDTVNDIEALFALRRAQSGLSQSSITALIEKQNQLLQTFSFLEQGLKNHFGFEEKALPPLFGELLMKALLHEHHEIDKQIETAKTTLTNIKLEGMDQQELLSKRPVIQRNIDNLCRTVEEHASHEEIILTMIKKALEEDRA